MVHFVLRVVLGSVAVMTLLSLLGISISSDLCVASSVQAVVVSVSIKLVED